MSPLKHPGGRSQRMMALAIATSFALACVLANWHFVSLKWKPELVVEREYDGALLIIAFSSLALIFLALSISKNIRLLRAQGSWIPAFTPRFFYPCLLLLLMLFRVNWKVISTASGQTTDFQQSGYGSDYSLYAMILASLTIVAFLYRSRLRHRVKSLELSGPESAAAALAPS